MQGGLFASPHIQAAAGLIPAITSISDSSKEAGGSEPPGAPGTSGTLSSAAAATGRPPPAPPADANSGKLEAARLARQMAALGRLTPPPRAVLLQRAWRLEPWLQAQGAGRRGPEAGRRAAGAKPAAGNARRARHEMQRISAIQQEDDWEGQSDADDDFEPFDQESM